MTRTFNRIPAQPIVRRAREWQPTEAVLALGLLVSLIYAHAGALRGMVDLWNVSPMYSYGYTVPLISGYLLWARRDALRALTPTSDRLLGVPVTLLGIALLVSGRAGGIQVLEQVAFLAREDKKIDKRSGVSQRLPISAMENVVSNAERRALMNREDVAVARVTDVYAALPSITGKFELEYEGELKGAEAIAREIIRAAVANVADGYLAHLETRRVIEWFDLGGSLQLGDTMSTADVLKHAHDVQGLVELARAAGIPKNASEAMLASGIDFVLEGLYATKKISRSEERGYHASEPSVRRPAREASFNDEMPTMPAGAKKKYYN